MTNQPTRPTMPIPSPRVASRDDGRRFTMLVIATAAIVGLVGAGLAFIGLRDSTPAGLSETNGEVFLEPAASTGTDPFFDEFSTLVSAPPPQFAPAAKSPNAGPATNAEILDQVFAGTEPGLYGGSGNNESCNRQALVAFLEENPDKAAAWAAVQGIEPADVRSYIDGLTTAVLTTDTRVTNHGFNAAGAYPLQSVLQAGTAVLLDAQGVPRAKCGCGNPLLKPVPQTVTVRYAGPAWDGFAPQTVAAVEPAAVTGEFVLRDVDTGATIIRTHGDSAAGDFLDPTPAPVPSGISVGSAGAVAPTLEVPSTTVAPTTSTTTSTTTTTTPPKTPVQVAARGSIGANSSFDGFPASLALDGNAATSWFSTGPGQGPAVFTWTGPVTDIAEVSFTGNGGHSNPQFRSGFGFAAVTVEVLSGGTVVWSGSGSGNGDSFSVGATGDQVRLTFTGHESNDCGGFAELFIVGLE